MSLFLSRRRLGVAAIAFTIGLTPLPVHAAVVFQFMSVDAESYVVSDNFTYSKDSYKSDASLTFKATRSATTSATLSKPGAVGSAASKVTGTFTTSSGSLQFTPQTTSMTVTSPDMLEAFAYATASFEYDFTLTTDMYLTYNEILATTGTQVGGTPFGQFLDVESNDGLGTVAAIDFFDGTSGGTVHLGAGRYTMRLVSDQLNWSDFTQSLGSNQTSLTSSFNYSFSNTAPVPEPAMLGLFGLGALGLRLSRRRR